MSNKTHGAHDAIRTIYNENPALGSYINRMGDRLGVGADEQAEAAETGADTDLTTLRERALAQAAGYDPSNPEERRDFILSVMDDPRFQSYAAAYRDYGKNGYDSAEYRYTVEQSVSMERMFNNYFPEHDGTEPPEPPAPKPPIAEPPVVEPPIAEPPAVDPEPAPYTPPTSPAGAEPPKADPKPAAKKTAAYKITTPKTTSYKVMPARKTPKPKNPVAQHPDRRALSKRKLPTYHVSTPPKKIHHRGLGERIITAAKDVYKHIKHFFSRISRD